MPGLEVGLGYLHGEGDVLALRAGDEAIRLDLQFCDGIIDRTVDREGVHCTQQLIWVVLDFVLAKMAEQQPKKN